MSDTKRHVEIEDDHISIHDENGEIVYWDQAEWEEDPELCLVIAEAINMFHTEGPEAMRKMLQQSAPVGYYTK